MNNFQKLALGLSVGAMAIGFSAFKSSENANTKLDRAIFFNKSGVQSNIASDYVYQPDGDCLAASTACSAEWNYTGTLTEGAHPNGSKYSTTDSQGAWDGN
ncbi:hypothetical protein [Pedobacter gandavensis]|uniref:Uncharacterized protein n=1 Tax=Pedobacter gandavensis TaxID=2679963 RepID=A0ABR6EUU3_9SPHI|nr:hypothetical protein [Pedobacter gandavensis]MBB2148957.1 hypothetical protein [Pedobacter gandavensis]